MKATLLGTLAALVVLSALGCGPTMESPTESKTLRILGVQKDKPYAVPGPASPSASRTRSDPHCR